MDAYLTTVEVAFIADVQQASARAVKGPRR